jgi:hypothetical protein
MEHEGTLVTLYGNPRFKLVGSNVQRSHFCAMVRQRSDEENTTGVWLKEPTAVKSRRTQNTLFYDM